MLKNISISISFFIVLLGVSELSDYFRREAVNDGVVLSILHSAPNFYSVFFVLSILHFSIKNQRNFVLGYFVGVILYEILQIWLPKRTFDFNDIYASFIGLLAFLLILSPLERNSYMHLITNFLKRSGAVTLPFIKQNQPGGDGLACINSILMHRGLLISLSDLESRFPDFKQGINLRQVMEIFNDYKIQSRALQCPINELKNLKLPSVLHWDMKQFVILAKIDDKKYEIINPADKKRLYTEDELERHYNEIALEILPGDKS